MLDKTAKREKRNSHKHVQAADLDAAIEGVRGLELCQHNLLVVCSVM